MTSTLLADLSRLLKPGEGLLESSFLADMRRQYHLSAIDSDTACLLRRIESMNSAVTAVSVGATAVHPSESTIQASNWGDWRWHVKNRVHLRRDSTEKQVEAALALIRGSGGCADDIVRVVRDGVDVMNGNETPEHRYYDLSILPLNLLLGERVLRYFIPPSDYFQPHATKKADPYGILWASSRAKSASKGSVAVVDPEGRWLLGAHKFSHTLLMNIDFYCPIGCSDCYKTRFGTREYVVPSADESSIPQIYQHSQFGDIRPPSAGEVVEHAERVVRWMNHDPRGQSVYDVIVSGGEPFILSDDRIKALLKSLESARNLRVVRFCTGTLFLGLPMRVDENLADILDAFSRRTGIRVTVHAHLACHEQITPESVLAVSYLRRRGISVYSQVPIKEGINFFAGDRERTIEALSILGRKQVAIGVEPYMFIVDMHPSTNAFYVPIEPLMAAWGTLVESHDFPGLERPRTLSILFEQGNVILSGNTLLAMEKIVDRKAGLVTYRIPRIGMDAGGSADIAEVFEYHEPLGQYNADPDSLKKLWLRRDSLVADN